MPATLFGEINGFQKFPVSFQVKYNESDLMSVGSLFYDKVYGVFYDANNKYQNTFFDCGFSNIDQRLVSKFANNIKKVLVEFNV